MKLKQNADVARLLQAVPDCRGSVIFVSEQGDRLDLKSLFCQFLLAMAEQEWQRGVLLCDDPDDYTLLEEFLTEDSSNDDR